MKYLARLLLPLVVVVGLLGAAASPASAAVCADYSNQAAAQAAADTRDADGDGIYCESLPCPCSTSSGSGGGGSAPKVTAPKRKAKAKKKRLTFEARITRVTDGDTINVKRLGGTGKRYFKVRLIGIDTPETKKPGTPVQCGGLEATSNMFSLAFPESTDGDGDGLLDTPGGSGARVVVRTDVTQDTYDRYGRLLAYVTRKEGNVNLGRRQISDGWAFVYVYNDKPFAQHDSFVDAEETAMAEDRGMWSLCQEETPDQ